MSLLCKLYHNMSAPINLIHCLCTFRLRISISVLINLMSTLFVQLWNMDALMIVTWQMSTVPIVTALAQFLLVAQYGASIMRYTLRVICCIHSSILILFLETIA